MRLFQNSKFYQCSNFSNGAPDTTIQSPEGHRAKNMKTSVLLLSETAKNYYESCRSKTLVSGFEKYVITDGERALFVNSDYEPSEGEVVFKCETRHMETLIQLYKPRPALASS